MTAKEFFENQSAVDVNRMVVDKNKTKYSRFELILFAEAYCNSELRRVNFELREALNKVK